MPFKKNIFIIISIILVIIALTMIIVTVFNTHFDNFQIRKISTEDVDKEIDDFCKIAKKNIDGFEELGEYIVDNDIKDTETLSNETCPVYNEYVNLIKKMGMSVTFSDYNDGDTSVIFKKCELGKGKNNDGYSLSEVYSINIIYCKTKPNYSKLAHEIYKEINLSDNLTLFCSYYVGRIN